MALGGCLTCVKYLLFIFNFLFWLAGCVMLGMGIWLVVDKKTFEGIEGLNIIEELNIGGYLLIIIGSIIMVVGFFGCCGAIRESQCLLVTFFICLFIIFGVLLGIGIYFAVRPEKTEESFRTIYKELADQYKKGEPAAAEQLENIHKKFKCCGHTGGSSDFPSASTKPYGCEPDPRILCPKPMSEKFQDLLSGSNIVIAGVSLGIGVLLLLGMIFSMVLCCAIRDSI